MKWYKTLSIHKRIILKELAIIIGGVKWEDLTRLGFGLEEKIDLLYNKLKLEGFDI